MPGRPNTYKNKILKILYDTRVYTRIPTLVNITKASRRTIYYNLEVLFLEGLVEFRLVTGHREYKLTQSGHDAYRELNRLN